MADITPVAPTPTGANPAPAAASAGGDAIVNTRGNAIVTFINASGASITATLAAGASPTRPSDGTFPPTTLAARAVTIPAGQSRSVQLFPADNDGNGKAQFTYSGVTSLSLQALQPN